MQSYTLRVSGARDRWKEIRWSLFVFPQIRDVGPTEDPNAVEVQYEGERPYPHVWEAQLAQDGFVTGADSGT